MEEDFVISGGPMIKLANVGARAGMETLARLKGLRIEQPGMGTGSVHGNRKQPICYSEPCVHWLGNECTMSRLAAAALCNECSLVK